jgi:hypothetical protein
MGKPTCSTYSQRLLYGCDTIHLNTGFLVATMTIGFMIEVQALRQPVRVLPAKFQSYMGNRTRQGAQVPDSEFNRQGRAVCIHFPGQGKRGGLWQRAS